MICKDLIFLLLFFVGKGNCKRLPFLYIQIFKQRGGGDKYDC